MDPHIWMRAIECHPASTEAIVTAASILISAAIPLLLWRLDKYREDQEQLTRSFHVVASLLGHVWGLDTELASLRRRAAGYGTTVPQDWVAWHARMGLPISTSFVEAVPRMDGAIERIVGPFRDAAMLTVAYNEFLDRATRLDRSEIDGRWAEVVARLNQYHILIDRSIKRALGVVQTKGAVILNQK